MFKVAIKWGYNYIVWRNQNGRCGVLLYSGNVVLQWQKQSCDKLKDRNIHDIKVHSRGTGSWNLGEPPHEGTQKILNKHNIPFDGMISELFEATDDFDYIVAMDQSNVDNIKSINPNLKGQLFELLEFSNMEESDVPDPYYTNNF